MGCVLPVCQDWHILLLLEGRYHWLGVDFPYIPMDTSAVGLTMRGSEKSGRLPTSSPATVQIAAATEHSASTASGHSAISCE